MSLYATTIVAELIETKPSRVIAARQQTVSLGRATMGLAARLNAERETGALRESRHRDANKGARAPDSVG